jgi:hypothetical protein
VIGPDAKPQPNVDVLRSHYREVAVIYKVFGPYRIRRDGRLISKTAEHLRAFWSEVEAESKGLPDACGCYVFSIRRRAWYVGLAEKQSFCRECFALHKLNQYNYSLHHVSGEPQLHLIAKLTPTGRFASPSVRGHRDIQFLETLLIGMALNQNEDLQNIRGTKFLREMRVPGILRTARGEGRLGPVRSLRDALGMSGPTRRTVVDVSAPTTSASAPGDPLRALEPLVPLGSSTPSRVM